MPFRIGLAKLIRAKQSFFFSPFFLSIFICFFYKIQEREKENKNGKKIERQLKGKSQSTKICTTGIASFRDRSPYPLNYEYSFVYSFSSAFWCNDALSTDILVVHFCCVPQRKTIQFLYSVLYCILEEITTMGKVYNMHHKDTNNNDTICSVYISFSPCNIKISLHWIVRALCKYYRSTSKNGTSISIKNCSLEK